MASTSSSSMANVLITPEDVLESLMNDGTIDAIRLKIITQLKANEELKNNIITMVEQSKVLNTPGAEKQTKRELFDSLRQELEIPALERASKSVWESILDSNGLGKEINETVENVFCRLSGREPPLFPPPSHNEDHVKDKENSSNETEHLDSPSRNKNVTETSGQIDESEAAEGLVGLTSVAVDSVPDLSTVATKRGNRVVAEEKVRCQRTDGKNWQCKNERISDQKYCEKHITRSKKPKKVPETDSHSHSRPVTKKRPKTVPGNTSNQAMESRPVRIKRLKTQVESSAKQASALVDTVVESSRNVISSTSTLSQDTSNTDSSSSSQARHNSASSPRLGSSPKNDVCDKENSL